MKDRLVFASLTIPFLTVTVALISSVGIPVSGLAHEGHDHNTFSAGEPGDARKPARVIKVKMREDGTKKFFEPARLEVRRGEQIRFVLENAGIQAHEFVIATAAENRKHAEEMKKLPDAEHDNPNAKRVAAAGGRELVWKFTKRGDFQFACLVAGHYDAGMTGTIVVK